MAPFEDPVVRPNIIRQGSFFCLTKSPKIAFFCSMLTFQTEKVIVYPNITLPLCKNRVGKSRFKQGCLLSGLAEYCGSLPMTARKTLASPTYIYKISRNPNSSTHQKAAMQIGKWPYFRILGVFTLHSLLV